MTEKLLHRVRRKLTHMRLQPIRVFCVHHVCAEFDAESMNQGDWMDIRAFKVKVTNLQKVGVKFIPISEAYRHICKDWIRRKKYAVLTFDDGYESLKEILPWLEEQKIPAVLFINGKYLDGKSYRKNPKEQYLTKDEIWGLTSPLIEIGNHGWEHIRVMEQTRADFEESVRLNVDLLSKHTRYVPFWAYTYGEHAKASDECLQTQSIVPLYVDGLKNYCESNVIHRELMN